MTTTWGNISKATGTSFTNVAKPVGTTSVVSLIYSGGQPIGLLLALTQSSVIGVTSIVTSLWTDVSGNTSAWVNVAKAT